MRKFIFHSPCGVLRPVGHLRRVQDIALWELGCMLQAQVWEVHSGDSQKEKILILLTPWRAAARRASAACLRRSALETGVHGAGAGMGGTQ